MLQWGGQNTVFAVTIGFYPEGDPGEVFISGAKVGSGLDAEIRGSAVLISLGLQYGVPLGVMQGAMPREQSGAPSGIAGKVVDMLVEAENE
jgi:hypothetical protein